MAKHGLSDGNFVNYSDIIKRIYGFPSYLYGKYGEGMVLSCTNMAITYGKMANTQLRAQLRAQPGCGLLTLTLTTTITTTTTRTTIKAGQWD